MDKIELYSIQLDQVTLSHKEFEAAVHRFAPHVVIGAAAAAAEWDREGVVAVMLVRGLGHDPKPTSHR